jgi:hypothetical protein
MDKNVKLNMINLNPYLKRCFFATVIIINLDFRDMFDLEPIFSFSLLAPFAQPWITSDLKSFFWWN